MNEYIEPKPYSLTTACYANISAELVDDIPTMERLIRQLIDEDFEKAMQNIPLGMYAEPPTVGFYQADEEFVFNRIRVVKQSKLKRVKNLGELLFDKPAKHE